MFVASASATAGQPVLITAVSNLESDQLTVTNASHSPHQVASTQEFSEQVLLLKRLRDDDTSTHADVNELGSVDGILARSSHRSLCRGNPCHTLQQQAVRMQI
jgi:hypothetical protein